MPPGGGGSRDPRGSAPPSIEGGPGDVTLVGVPNSSPSRRRRFAPTRPRRLRLRTKVSVLFGFVALVAGASVAVFAYNFARASLLDQRRVEARQAAVVNAREVLNLLESGEELQPALDELTDEGGFIQVFRDNGRMEAAAPIGLTQSDIIPDALRQSVTEGVSAIQRFRYGGTPYFGVGIRLARVDAQYFEAFSLESTERTLRGILFRFSLGSAAAVLLLGGFGIWTGRRLLRPLGQVTEAAQDIAEGDLSTRVAPQRDRDLEPLVDAFNGMADAVQDRIERESRFVSDVSHELRSPITALQAATDVLERRRSEFSDRPGQAVDVIIDQVRRFDGMVLDLLELSRIDAGASDMHVESSDIVDTSRRIAAHYGFPDLVIDVDPNAPSRALIDRVRYERILGNLLENAKHHADGPTRISVERPPAGPDDADDETNGSFVLVAVEDDGPGVEPAERERIFGRFARGRVSRHRVGTGLGLALVTEHAKALGGSTWVEEAPGGGARFVVSLPADTTFTHTDAEAAALGAGNMNQMEAGR